MASVAKRNILLVDADPRSLRVLEVSLRKAGYSVTTSGDVDAALELLELSEPDMIIADTRFVSKDGLGRDGFAFVSELRSRPTLAQIPFMFLSSDPSVESKVRGLELGIEDYLAKPVYIREILARVNLVMERKEREGFGRTAKTRFSGSLEDMGLVDLLQTIDLSRKSGVLKLSSGPRRGTVMFAEGRVIEAELGKLTGEAAIYRFLLWNEGSFEIEFGEARGEDKLGISTQALLMEGVRRLDEWGRLQEQLPGLHAVLEVDHVELMQRLGEIPDELNIVLRAFDAQRDLAEVLEVAAGDDLVTLTAISKLFFDGFLRVRHRSAPSGDAQVGSQSDPFIGLVPQESAPPGPPSVPPHGKPGPSAVSSVPAHFGGPEGEPIRDDGVRTSSFSPRFGGGEPVLAAGRVPLAVLQLKRVPAISVRGPNSSAGESEGDSMKRSKRRERDGEQRSNDNVIPLHAGFRDSSTGEGSERHPSARSSEQRKSDRPSDPRSSSNGMRTSESPPADVHDDDPFEVRDFFASTPKSIGPSGEPWHDFDGDHEVPPSRAHHRGMFWTLGIAGTGLLLIGLFLLYNKVLMPTPEEFAIKRPITLPTPDMLTSSLKGARPVAPPAAVQAGADPAQAAPAPEPNVAEPILAEPNVAEPNLANPNVAGPIAAEPNSAVPNGAEPALAASPTAEPGSAAQVANSPVASDEYAHVLGDARKLGFRKPAEDLYLKAISLNPGGAEAISGLAMLYLNQGKNAQAKQRAEQAIALSQSSDEGWIVLGAAESAMGKERLAREAYAHCAALPAGKYVSECKRLAR